MKQTATKKEIINKFNCPSALWLKFTDNQKSAYNNIRAVKRKTIDPNNCGIVNTEDWDVISHNYSVLAALEVK